MISTRQTGPADEHLARNTDRDLLQVTVQQQDAGVGDRPADGESLMPGISQRFGRALGRHTGDRPV